MRTQLPEESAPIVADVYILEGDRGWRHYEASRVFWTREPAGGCEITTQLGTVMLVGILRVEYR